MPKNEADVMLGTAGIGLGHTFYGQTLENPLDKSAIRYEWYEARNQAEQLGSRLFWWASNVLYEQGSNPDIRNAGYEWLRKRSNRDSFFIRPARNETRHVLSNFDGVYVSAHAHTAVKGRGPLVVLQGDYYGGKDYAVPEADLTVVPTTVSRKELVAYGIDPDKIEVVGFFSDRRLKEPQIRSTRIAQLDSEEPTHIGLYFTGARSHAHAQVFEKLLSELTPTLKQKRAKLTIYTVNDPRLAHHFEVVGMTHGLKTIRFRDDGTDGDWNLQIVHGTTAREANDRALTALGDPENPISILVTMVGERLSMAPDVALVPIRAFNNINAGGNTIWGEQRGFFEPPSATERLPERLQKGETIIFKENMERAKGEMNTDGAENTVRIIKERGLLQKAA